MELDNRAVALDTREAEISAREFAVGKEGERVDLEREAVRGREVVVEGREAGLRYSAVEQRRLEGWMRRLEEREGRVGEAERNERERIAVREGVVGRREVLVGERERRVEEMFRNREEAVGRRERIVDEVRESVLRERADMLVRIKAERAEFWTHQQRLSAVVAAETEALLAEQARLRTEFLGGAAEARREVEEMKQAVDGVREGVASVVAERQFGKEFGQLSLAELDISTDVSPEDTNHVPSPSDGSQDVIPAERKPA